MAIPSGLIDDIYQGTKQGFRKAPLLWSMMMSLWTLVAVVYLWVYPQLARAADVKLIENKVDIVLRLTLEDKLKDMVKVRCDSPANYYWTLQTQITKQKEEYESLTARTWKEPTCEEAKR